MPDRGSLTRAGAPFDFGPGTLVDVFLKGVHRDPGRRALTSRQADGKWRNWTASEVSDRVRHLSAALRARGLDRGDHVAILANTSLEWALVDWACIMSGLPVVTVYPTLTPGQVRFILEDSRARAVFVQDGDHLAKVLQVHDRLSDLEHVIVFEPPSDDRTEAHGGITVESLEDVERDGRRAPPSRATWEADARQATTADKATLIYTSGTTGDPKGVVLTHHNLFTNTVASSMVIPIDETDRVLAWLPLSHAFERLAGHYLMWYAGAEIAYAESSLTVARDMVEVRPSLMIGVPRLYEKFYDAVFEAVREGGVVKRAGFVVAKWFGDRHAERRLARRRIGLFLRAGYGLADHIVFRKLHEKTGGRVKFFVSGAAPLSAEIARFFYSGGLVVLEGYGLTETSPVTNVNPPDDIRFGTVGPPVAGTEIRIADDGEILVRGPQVMLGYYNRPQETREAIDPDGWLHTGDIGELDPDGYLRITDRKKNIIVTAAGKNIAPQPIEERIARSPFVEQVVLLGDRRKFPLALVVPSFQAFKAALPGRPVTESNREELSRSPAIQRLLDEEVARRVTACARYERPKRVLVVGHPFTVENGQLTPTLKVKRRAIEKEYRARIEEIYRMVEAEAEPCA